VSSPIVAAPGAVLSVNSVGLSGLTGQLGITVVDDDDNVIIPRAVTGVLEMPPGSGCYLATVTVPLLGGTYLVLWDNGNITPFTVSAAFDTEFSHEELRGFGLVRKEPRGFRIAAQGVYSMLVDEASVVRQSDEGEVDDGTPILTSTDYGPYASRISPVQRQETREQDKYTAVESHTLQIATDLIIVESDLFDIVCQDPTRTSGPGEVLRYRVVSGVAPRTPGWRAPLIWHVPVQLTTEY
jgi:hypothetical protein